jgi:hypothetical protein
MKLRRKYLLLIALLLFADGGPKADQNFAFGSPVITQERLNNEGNINSAELLFIQNSDQRTVNHGEKIETVKIPLPSSNNQVTRHLNFLLFFFCGYRNRMISLMAFSRTYISKISNVSRLADILRI